MVQNLLWYVIMICRMPQTKTYGILMSNNECNILLLMILKKIHFTMMTFMMKIINYHTRMIFKDDDHDYRDEYDDKHNYDDVDYDNYDND